MKAITLWQPWASLISCGAKTYETRSWAPPRALVGQRIAIHAAKQKVDQLTGNLPPAAWVPAVDALSAAIGDFRWKDLPLGVVVCTAVLSAAYQCGAINDDGQVYVTRSISRGDTPLFIQSDDFGDFSLGRWAWLLEDIEPLAAPAKATGKQGWWTWEPISFSPPPLRHIPAPGGFPATVQE